MGLLNVMQLDNGFEANYWKISRIEICGGIVSCQLLGFKDKEARDSSKQCVKTIVFNWISSCDSNPFSLCYDKIKLEDNFKDSVDC